MTFKKTRVYSLFTIPHLLALLFVAPFSANGIEYKGHGYTYLRGYPFHCNGMRTLTGKVIFQTYSYDVNLVYDKQGIPVFFLYESDSYSGLGRCKIWDLKGNFLFDPEKFTMIDYHNEWVYTISVEKKYEIRLDNIGEKYPYNRVSFRLYDFEGNYIK